MRKSGEKTARNLRRAPGRSGKSTWKMRSLGSSPVYDRARPPTRCLRCICAHRQGIETAIIVVPPGGSNPEAPMREPVQEHDCLPIRWGRGTYK